MIICGDHHIILRTDLATDNHDGDQPVFSADNPLL
jgi:hypothetical protein